MEEKKKTKEKGFWKEFWRLKKEEFKWILGTPIIAALVILILGLPSLVYFNVSTSIFAIVFAFLVSLFVINLFIVKWELGGELSVYVITIFILMNLLIIIMKYYNPVMS